MCTHRGDIAYKTLGPGDEASRTVRKYIYVDPGFVCLLACFFNMGAGIQILMLTLAQEVLHSSIHPPLPSESFLRAYRMQCSVCYNWGFPT